MGSWKLSCIRVDGKMRRMVILIFATAVLSENPQNCTADAYESIRDKYESCANNKILTITATIQSNPQHSDQDRETIICSAVKKLINDCGEVLNSCFSVLKIEETKSKQTDGIKKILAKHYTETEIKNCFVDDKLQFNSEREKKSFKDSAQIRVREEESLKGAITSSPIIEENHDDFTPASTTVSDDNMVEKEETLSSKTSENVLKYSSTESFSIIGDQGTTPSSVLPLKCTEVEFLENRNNYERCASNKIREITAWLDRREHRLRNDDSSSSEDDKRSIMTVCNAVRQLLYDCGDELGWCFTEDQVTKTRYKQKAGLEDILSKYYSPDTLKMCFIQKKVSILITTTQETISETVEEQEKKVLRAQKFYPELSSYSRGARENLSITIVLSLLLALLVIL